MVVLRPNEVLESFANSKVPPVIEREPAPKAPAAVPRKVPPVKVTAPVKLFVPSRINLPGPDIVSPFEPLMVDPIVTVSPALVTMIAFVAALAPERLIVPEVMLIPFALKVKPAATVTVSLTVGAALAVSKINAPEAAWVRPVVPPPAVAVAQLVEELDQTPFAPFQKLPAAMTAAVSALDMVILSNFNADEVLV